MTTDDMLKRKKMITMIRRHDGHAKKKKDDTMTMTIMKDMGMVNMTHTFG